MLEKVPGEIVSKDILELLPHRYPFLLVDRVLEYEPFKYIKAIKCVSINEPFFQGHFPSYPVMPGVLILESLAQAGGILVMKSIPEEVEDKIFLFTGMEKVRFRKSVFPGDTLTLEVHYEKHKLNLWKMRAQALLKQEVAAQGILSAAIVPREDR
ncbi:MAG TPA: 3-hydroxyacyl-[acyl-carrier-protein] dehydratase FabZ [Desulfonauticus sp.]|jgi:3-hydroxyacyl-[acyl-carrier-protein] dehydratase|nr:MAG: 3-hydroxyacyl-[acyl-carrier-protein] dehydratase FabZ [Desulfonauticus sp. 38_4375]MDK2920980.1 3-hydroxyacyl-[acyl-carrier-protein] dehydratase [Desulfonauticus sp.]HCO11760.1 3-hydroxyacyl-[acyl-carrier-protein] dehydratase FabZ [Desulfonauticus sp.]